LASCITHRRPATGLASARVSLRERPNWRVIRLSIPVQCFGGGLVEEVFVEAVSNPTVGGTGARDVELELVPDDVAQTYPLHRAPDGGPAHLGRISSASPVSSPRTATGSTREGFIVTRRLLRPELPERQVALFVVIYTPQHVGCVGAALVTGVERECGLQGRARTVRVGRHARARSSARPPGLSPVLYWRRGRAF
jgi:hypothetical protein